MHSDHDIEKEIRYNLRGTQLRKPPRELLNTFEEQVWGRITAPRPAFPGFHPAIPVVILLSLLLAGYVLWVLKQPSAPMPEPASIETAISEPVSEESVLKPTAVLAPVSTEETHSTSESAPGITDEMLDRRIQDLLVLEWLGEADGLLDDWNQTPVMAENALPGRM